MKITRYPSEFPFRRFGSKSQSGYGQNDDKQRRDREESIVGQSGALGNDITSNGCPDRIADQLIDRPEPQRSGFTSSRSSLQSNQLCLSVDDSCVVTVFVQMLIR